MARQHVDVRVRRDAVDAAAGRRPFDLLLTGGRLVDVSVGEVREADVGLVGPLIASVHAPGTRRDADQIEPLDGRFLAPGFMDLHVHIEGSMCTPAGYAELVVPRGTTTVFADPHELANVAGVAGVRYAVEASRTTPLRVIVQAPSCVPPAPGLEVSGADFLSPEIDEVLSWSEVGGLGEVMDWIGVTTGTPRIVDIVAAGHASGKLVSGHALGLRDSELQAYLAAGVDSDHSMLTADEAIEKLRAGMTIELCCLRPGLVEQFVAELTKLPVVPTSLVTCTDDAFAATLLERGGIDHLLRLMIGSGLDPVQALRCATINCAYRLQREDLGLIAAGRWADVVVLDDLPAVDVAQVYAGGQLVARGGELVVANGADTFAHGLRDTAKVQPFSDEDFELTVPGVTDGRATIRTKEGLGRSSWGTIEVDVHGGVAQLPDGYLVQAVAHRHGRREQKPARAIVGGWGDWTCAVATTFSHDTHNLVVFGRDAADMRLAANTVARAGGGVAVVHNGEVLANIDLPIAGLMSPLPPPEVAVRQRAISDALCRFTGLAVGPREPLLQVMVATLTCLPGPQLTDLGLIDGSTGELVPA
jgi:adenine deaminase